MTIGARATTITRHANHREEGIGALTLLELAIRGQLLTYSEALYIWSNLSEEARSETLRTYYSMRAILH